jgi:hypothetical protein
MSYRLERQQWIEAPLRAVYAFFSAAENLETITPRWLGFRIRTPRPIEVRAGARIDYTIRLGGLPLRWRTRITEWQPDSRFVDLQESGPYARWEHTHTFRELGGGVLMTDVVEYDLPFGWLGRLAHGTLVRALLARIFDYRFARVREIFGAREGAHA